MTTPPRLTTVLLAIPLAATLLLAGCGDEGSARRTASSDFFVVERSAFDMSIPVSGELSAQRQVEIRNRLESRAVITEIVPEGKTVRQGDVLLRLAEEEIRDRIKDAQEKVNSAQSDLVAAEQTLAIRESTRASDLEKADLAIELARLALLAWEEGELISKRQSLALAKETADINLARLEDRFNESAKLLERKFISKDEFERDRIAMIEARARAQQARLDLDVYEQYQYVQDRAKKESDYKQAIEERRRVEQRHFAEIVKSKSDVESARFRLSSAKDRLANLELQLSYCTVTAPNDGLVVYATSIDSGGGGRGGGDAQPPQVGTELRPNELVIILPDTTQMVANLKVSEALSGRIRPNQPVTVYSDALPNVPIRGTVQSVSVLAASGGWRDPNRRDYTVRVALDVDPELGLKPSMRCKAEILLDRVTDAVSVPIQSIFRQGGVAFVYVEDRGGLAQRQVQLGRASELRVEVVEGIREGDRILLREPRPEEVVAKLDFDALQQQMPADGRGGPPPGVAAAPAAPTTEGDALRGRPRGPRQARGAEAAPTEPVVPTPSTAAPASAGS
jgi:HlyD family secretion protein